MKLDGRDVSIVGLLVVVALLVGFIVGDWGTGNSGGGSFEVTTQEDAQTTTTPAVPPAEPSTTVAVAPDQSKTSFFSDLPPIEVAALPPEAVDVMLLIRSNGPYPFSKDGSTFQNREGFLPDFPRGHYREFTVITPGSSDRGARRIVAGDLGEMYYTSDHYASFSEIVE